MDEESSTTEPPLPPFALRVMINVSHGDIGRPETTGGGGGWQGQCVCVQMRLNVKRAEVREERFASGIVKFSTKRFKSVQGISCA